MCQLGGRSTRLCVRGAGSPGLAEPIAKASLHRCLNGPFQSEKGFGQERETLAGRWWAKAKKMQSDLECLGSSKTYVGAEVEGAERDEGRWDRARDEVRRLGCSYIEKVPGGSSSRLSHLC